jgi:hypothetical protein
VKKLYPSLLSAAIVCLLTIVFSITSCFAYQGGSGIPSCHDDIAAKRTEPGVSPNCTPPILTEEKSLDILKNFVVKKVKGKWYMFLSAEEFEGKLDSASRWKSISFLIQAVESMFAEKAECFIVRVPETAEEKAALLEGTYPQELIAASAKYVELTEEEESSKKWPEYHHPLFYKITVY